MQKKLIFSLCLTLIIVKVNAASLGTYRIYLDNNKRQDKFVVKNQTIFPEQCEVSINYRQYRENGQVVKLANTEKAERSKAILDRVRYSPRKFIIQPKSQQYVNFKYRRQINDKVAEHRTYVNFTCAKIKDKQQHIGINLTPSIVLSVPLVIRTAPLSKMALSLSFLKIKQQGKSISFRLQHAGNRSFIGDIHLMTENGTKLLTLQRNFALYSDMVYKDFTFDLGEHHDKKVKIVFQENSQYGGSELFELPLQGAK
jgi:hypothetical protein